MPDACTLSPADRAGRAAEFEGCSAARCAAVSRAGRRDCTWTWSPARRRRPGRPGWRRRRRQCCSFFTFTLTAADGTLTLDVTVPDSQVPVLDALADRALAARTPLA